MSSGWLLKFWTGNVVFGVGETVSLTTELRSRWYGDGVSDDSKSAESQLPSSSTIAGAVTPKGTVKQRGLLFVAIPTLLTLVLMLAVSAVVWDAEDSRLRSRFGGQCEVIAAAIGEKLSLMSAPVVSIGSLFAASNRVDRSEFATFAEAALKRYPSLQALEWVPKVSAAVRAQVEADMRSGVAGSSLKQWTSDQGWQPNPEDWTTIYYPVLYAAPLVGNERAIGVDLGSHPKRMAALRSAMSGDQPIASAPVTLAQFQNPTTGYLLFYPVHGKGAQAGEVVGFSLGVFEAAAVLEDVWPSHLSVVVSDGGDVVYEGGLAGRSEAWWAHRYIVRFGGRKLSVTIAASPGWVAEQHGLGARLLMFIGLALTLLVWIFLRNLARQRVTIEATVARQTEALRRSSESLKQTNKDLLHFASVASHDLRQPLRTIMGFSSMLLRRAKDLLDPDHLVLVERINEGVEKMDSRVGEMLAYSKLSSTESTLGCVDLEQVANEVQQSLADLLGASSGTVSWSELGPVRGDKVQLTQLLQNLVANGLTYRREGVAPRVHLSKSRDSDGSSVLAVADNGIGIPAKHHERVFQMFRRLHTEQEVPGTGLGLAICQRIAQRHGGHMWLESVPGEGTTFYVRLASAR